MKRSGYTETIGVKMTPAQREAFLAALKADETASQAGREAIAAMIEARRTERGE